MLPRSPCPAAAVSEDRDTSRFSKSSAFPPASPARHVGIETVTPGYAVDANVRRRVYKCYQRNNGTPRIRPATSAPGRPVRRFARDDISRSLLPFVRFRRY